MGKSLQHNIYAGSIASNLKRAYRADKELPKRLSQKIGLSESSVRNWMYGIGKIAAGHVIIIADELGVSVEDLAKTTLNFTSKG